MFNFCQVGLAPRMRNILSLFSYHLKHFLLPVLIPIFKYALGGGGGGGDGGGGSGADTKLGRKS